MKLNPRTQTGYYTTSDDLALHGFMTQFLLPGMTFWDLGANQGVFSLIAAQLVGPTGHVLAFEPDPELAARLKENAARNDCSNIRIFQAAVGAVDGSVIFDRGTPVNSADFGQGRIVSSVASPSGEQFLTVPCLTLDALLLSEVAPDFIKCDVEGAEAEVFAAGRNLLEKHLPYIECEVHSRRAADLLTQLFSELAYSVKWYSENHFFAIPSFRC